MSDFKKVELGDGLSDKQIVGLGSQLARIFRRDRVHLSDQAVNEVLNSDVDMGITPRGAHEQKIYDYARGEVQGSSIRVYLGGLDNISERFLRILNWFKENS